MGDRRWSTEITPSPSGWVVARPPGRTDSDRVYLGGVPDQAIPSAHDHALFAPSETGHLSRDGEALHEVRGYTSRPVAWNLIHTHSAVSLKRRSRERTSTSSTLLAHESMTVSWIVFRSATDQQLDLLDSWEDRLRKSLAVQFKRTNREHRVTHCHVEDLARLSISVRGKPRRLLPRSVARRECLALKWIGHVVALHISTCSSPSHPETGV